jgi:teichuronic acid biosynthesis glycosyltransferase TuaC
MRIALATTSYPADTGDPSGHFVRAHARQLARHGAEVVVFAPGRGSANDVEGAGPGQVRVIHLGGEALFTWPGAAARAREVPWRLAVAPAVAARSLVALAREGPFDRAVAHWIPSAYAFAGRSLPLHVIAHGADVRLLLAAPRFARARVVRGLLVRRARIQFVASSLQTDLAASLPDEVAADLRAGSFVEPAPFELPDDSSGDDTRRSLGLDLGAPYVAWLGRLVRDKRPELAIDAARLMGRTLVIVGDGPLLSSLARRPGVLVTGRLPRERAIAVMRGASAVVHTSAVEGAPTVVREARALGIPVVACEAGDVARWAARDGGISIAAAEATAIARAITAASIAPRSVVHHGGDSPGNGV